MKTLLLFICLTLSNASAKNEASPPKKVFHKNLSILNRSHYHLIPIENLKNTERVFVSRYTAFPAVIDKKHLGLPESLYFPADVFDGKNIIKKYVPEGYKTVRLRRSADKSGEVSKASTTNEKIIETNIKGDKKAIENKDEKEEVNDKKSIARTNKKPAKSKDVKTKQDKTPKPVERKPNDTPKTTKVATKTTTIAKSTTTIKHKDKKTEKVTTKVVSNVTTPKEKQIDTTTSKQTKESQTTTTPKQIKRQQKKETKKRSKVAPKSSKSKVKRKPAAAARTNKKQKPQKSSVRGKKAKTIKRDNKKKRARRLIVNSRKSVKTNPKRANSRKKSGTNTNERSKSRGSQSNPSKLRKLSNKHRSRRAVNESRRLISGQDTSIEEYPYMISIQKGGEHWCSGALLNPRLAVTTANCMWRGSSISRMRVRACSRYSDRGGQLVNIAQVMRHPRWNLRDGPDFDVALILFDRFVRFSHSCHGAEIPNRIMYPPFEDAWVSSYGTDRRDGIFGGTMILHSYHARTINRDKCTNITQRYGVLVSDNFICLAQAGRRAPCTRDTGAPAVSDGIVFGLASWGIRKLCGTERFPAMFSYLASHSNMDFITTATASLMSENREYPFGDAFPVPQGVTGGKVRGRVAHNHYHRRK